MDTCTCNCNCSLQEGIDGDYSKYIIHSFLCIHNYTHTYNTIQLIPVQLTPLSPSLSLSLQSSRLQHGQVPQTTPRNLENPRGCIPIPRKRRGNDVWGDLQLPSKLHSNGPAGKFTKVPGTKKPHHRHRISASFGSLLVLPDLPPYGLAHPQGHRENGSCRKRH